jgi:Mrp family chromosome partitioning ATPase
LPKLINELRPQFDIIVFDCPPVLLFVDALLVGARTDGVVMIYKAGKIARRALKRAKDQIVAAKGNIIGVVLNDMRSTDMEPRYGYYYDYEHYAKANDQTQA